MAAGSIIIDLLMRTGRFETDTKRAQKALRDMEKQAVAMGKAMGVALAAAGTAAAYFVKSSIDAADAASKQAAALGLTIEAYTGLEYAAGLSGLATEDFGASMSKLTKAASEAAGGNKEYAATFKAIGVAVTDSRGNLKSMDALLGDLAERFAGYADGAEKTALAIELFGKSGAKLVPFLNLGRDGIAQLREEAVRLGVVLDKETGVAAEQFNDNLTRLETKVKGFSYTLARELLPALNDVLQALIDRGFMGALDRLGEIVFPDFVRQEQLESLAALNGQLALIEERRKAIASDSLKGGALQLFGISGESLDRDEAKIRGQVKAIEDAIKRVDDAKRNAAQKGIEDRGFDPRATAPKVPGSGAGGKSGSSAKSDADRYLENLQKQLQGTKDLSVAETVLADIQAGRLGKVLPAQQDALLVIAKQIDAARLAQGAEREATRVAQERASARKAEDEAITASIAAAKEADAARLKALTGDTYSEKLKAVISDVEFLNRAYQQGAVDVTTWAEAVKAATGRIAAQSEVLDDFAKTMAENVQSFLGESFAQIMEGNFDDIGKSFTRMINRMVAEAIAADLARRIFGKAGGGSGDGWIGAAITAIGGYFGGAKAGGGDVMSGRSYLVGERGPELFMPRTAGTILPANVTAARGAGSTMVISNNFSIVGPVDRRTESQIAAAAGRGIQRAVGRIG